MGRHRRGHGSCPGWSYFWDEAFGLQRTHHPGCCYMDAVRFHVPLYRDLRDIEGHGRNRLVGPIKPGAPTLCVISCRQNQGPLPDSIQGTWREDGVGAGENAAPPRLKQSFSPEEVSTESKASSDARLDKRQRRSRLKSSSGGDGLESAGPALLHLPLTAQFKLIS